MHQHLSLPHAFRRVSLRLTFCRVPELVGRQEESMWRWFMGVAALPSAMVAVAYKLLPESPRFLSVMGRHDEAARVRAVWDRVGFRGGAVISR